MTIDHVIQSAQNCTICEKHLPLGPRPVFTAGEQSRIIVIGQAPGSRVHETGIAWNDPSGDNLRQWMGVDKDVFYDTSQISLIPMGFCYSGTSKSGDLPPRKECAPEWHEKLRPHLANARLTLLIGAYAQAYYLGKSRKKNLTNTVQAFADYLPEYFVLPHPSPRNNIWQAKNPWFKANVLPALSIAVNDALRS